MHTVMTAIDLTIDDIRFNQPDQSKCACTSDYYLVDIEDASHTTYAAIIVPAIKPVGAGAFQRALSGDSLS